MIDLKLLARQAGLADDGHAPQVVAREQRLRLLQRSLFRHKPGRGLQAFDNVVDEAVFAAQALVEPRHKGAVRPAGPVLWGLRRLPKKTRRAAGMDLFNGDGPEESAECLWACRAARPSKAHLPQHGHAIGLEVPQKGRVVQPPGSRDALRVAANFALPQHVVWSICCLLLVISASFTWGVPSVGLEGDGASI